MASSLKNIIAYMAMASLAGTGSTFALKDSDLITNFQSSITSVQQAVIGELQPILDKVMQGEK